MNAAVRAKINRNNARNSTGPKGEKGKQIAAMNGFKHGLTGQRMILQPHEADAYRRIGAAFHAQYKPQSEIESQLVQHIVDCNMHLNRAAAIDSNLLNAGLAENIREDGNDDVTETVLAQTRAWVSQEDSFDKLSRYEGRISRQLFQYLHELEHVQNLRKSQEITSAASSEATESKDDSQKLGSFRKSSSPDYLPRVMTAVSIGSTGCAEPVEIYPAHSQGKTAVLESIRFEHVNGQACALPAV
jgi:hypothetical protein